MSTIKLSGAHRERLLARLMKGRFDDEQARLSARWAALADAVYRHHFSAGTRQKMEALPKGWLPEDNDVTVQFGENGAGYQRLTFGGRKILHGFTMADEHRRFPAEDKGRCLEVFAEDHPLTLRFRALEADTAALKKARDELAAQVTGILWKASTISGLVKLWPEIEPIVKEVLPIASITTPQVPAPLLKDLNKRLGLRRAA